MKVELTLLELNELYYLTSKEVERQTQFIQNMSGPDTMNYYVRELSKVTKLRDRLSKQLFNEVKELDEFVDTMRKAQLEDRVLGNI